ncbi:MAG TPA: twin-arginine translocation signal domain-containing protein [Enhygromyxa sp.]|nr:twin-arginine translocation signal domain-containing protein [Enhygromyxa sp.]
MTDAQPKPTRRSFLALTAVGATVAAAAGGVTWWVKHRGELEELEPPEPMSETGAKLAALLIERLDMLKLPEATVSKWVNRYEKHEGPWKGKKVARKDLQNFLLSTDLFPDGDDSKPLRFVSYYDPYISVCYNPIRFAV